MGLLLVCTFATQCIISRFIYIYGESYRIIPAPPERAGYALCAFRLILLTLDEIINSGTTQIYVT